MVEEYIMATNNLWYIKSKDQISGPFAAKLISKRVLLGRIQLDDEASADNVNWLPVSDIDELVPDLLKKDQSDPFVKERIAAARRWSDERSRDRRDLQGNGKQSEFASQRSGSERRQIEDVGEMNYRESREQRLSSRDSDVTIKHVPKSYTIHSVIFLILVLAGVYAAYMYLPRAKIETANTCDALAAPSVNWSNCSLEGIDASRKDMQQANLKNANLTGASLRRTNLSNAELSYVILSVADLRGANLTNSKMLGANFRNADLTGVDFTSSNLSYANFTGAILLNANFKNANLEKAIWFDGSMCAAGSIGQCN